MRSHRSEPQIAEAYAKWFARTQGGTITDPMLKEREEFFKQLKLKGVESDTQEND